MFGTRAIELVANRREREIFKFEVYVVDITTDSTEDRWKLTVAKGHWKCCAVSIS